MWEHSETMDGFGVISPAPRAVWDEVLAADPQSLPSQSPQWMHAICDSAVWRDASRCYTTESGRRAVLPLASIGSGATTAYASPRRGWGYGGLIAEGGVTPEDIAVASADMSRLRALKFHVRPNPLQAPMWEKFAPEMCRTRKEVHILDLRGGEDAAFEKLHKSAKKGIKAAERCGVRIESASGDQLLGIFFELTYAARAQWAGQQHEPVWLAQLRGRFRDSERKWKNIAKHFGPNLRVYVAWCDDRPAAAGIVLRGRNVHGARAAMDREVANRSGATHALNWAVIKDACASGAQSFHMGESATKGAADFKRFLGAECVPFDEIDYERFPLSRANRATRSLVKKVVGFKEDDVNAVVS